jgi:hypothetical protein
MNTEPISVFRIAKHKSVSDKYCGTSVLHKLNFCFDSVFYKIQGKVIVDIYNDLSDYNRILMVNHRSKTVPKSFKMGA